MNAFGVQPGMKIQLLDHQKSTDGKPRWDARTHETRNVDLAPPTCPGHVHIDSMCVHGEQIVRTVK